MILSYSERAKICKNPIAKRLFNLMETKKTNLALSADVTQSQALLQLADYLGPYICVLKTHIDIIEDFTPNLTHQLKDLAKKHDFVIFEDRKFADIGNTVKNQYEGGVYQIASWADITNAHVLPGPGIIQGLAEVGLKQQRGLLLLAQMSSSENLLTPDYTQQTVKMAEQYPEFVIGFISQHRLSNAPHWIYMTPGIQFNNINDLLGQEYISPEVAIRQNGTDIIIVGRGIIQSDNALAAASKYRTAGWEAYKNVTE